MTKPGLSKSKISAFEQCPKRLWLQSHQPEFAPSDPSREARFAIGDEVGEKACELAGPGQMIEANPSLAAALDETANLLASGYKAAIFEGTFAHQGVLIRADIMAQNAVGGWDVAEVKSSTKVKDYHKGDLATQIWVMQHAGVAIGKASIRHINNQFKLGADRDYRDLFFDADLSQEIGPIIAGRDLIVEQARATLSGEEPTIETGPQCTSPFECEFRLYCTKKEGRNSEWPISELPNTGRAVAEKWKAQNKFDLSDLSVGDLDNPLHERIRQTVASQTIYHDAVAVRSEVAEWKYPRTYLDFETIAFAIPRWVGTNPYQQTPFQFSAIVETSPGEVLDPIDFIDLSGEDPRRACAAALSKLPREGSVIAWNKSFEARCLKDLALHSPVVADPLFNLAERLVDPLPIARRHYYHPKQRGSWSIKKVLPAIAPELGYEDLDISDGGQAQAGYQAAVSSQCSPARKRLIEENLVEYCRLDTVGMREVVVRLCQG